ncbi:Achaete-scute transcription factor-related protein [Dioscorea alata]|uniref:Achaete-scute transcription factor-related protein n=1 Tax=Dioscorea alata TaxID=55571 RepID=A0ACB7W2W8_DIOAL|nr:Achaete-scute transcription factor-related protein [Dioscorea alata]
MKNGSEEAKVERKTVEKNRRIHMKHLCFKLSKLIPKEDKQSSKQASTASNDLDQAACYIKKLKERIENLNQKKTATIKTEELINENNGAKMIELNRLPLIEIKELGSVLEVVLISELGKPFIFHKVISVLEEEGAVVINASFSVVGDKIYHTILTQADGLPSGFEASTLSQRINELVL